MYFNHIIEEFISSRRQLIVRQFLDALTVGGPGGTPRQGLLSLPSAAGAKRYMNLGNVVCHVAIVASGREGLKKYWPIVMGCVLRTVGRSYLKILYSD